MKVKTNTKTTATKGTTNNSDERINAIELQLQQLITLMQGTQTQAQPKASKGHTVKGTDTPVKVKSATAKKADTDLDKFALPIDDLMTLAVKEAKTSTRANTKRYSLVPYDIRIFITHGTNSAIKAYCRASKGTADAVSITDVSARLVAMYEKTNGKGSAKGLWDTHGVEVA